MITMMEIMNKAKEAGFEKWADLDSVSRGWYVNLLSEEGKKVRMNEEDLAKQQIFTEECLKQAELEAQMEIKKADEPVPTITNVLDTDEDILEVEYTPEDLTQYNAIDLESKYQFTVITDERGTYEITNKLLDHIQIMALAGKAVKTVLVTCQDCGRLRMVKVQDEFQVDRCIAHMKSYRNAVRRAKRKATK